jgi:hypothetical protein
MLSVEFKQFSLLNKGNSIPLVKSRILSNIDLNIDLNKEFNTEFNIDLKKDDVKEVLSKDSFWCSFCEEFYNSYENGNVVHKCLVTLYWKNRRETIWKNYLFQRLRQTNSTDIWPVIVDWKNYTIKINSPLNSLDECTCNEFILGNQCKQCIEVGDKVIFGNTK